MFSKTTVLIALQAGLALAGNAILSNNCDYDIWVSSVGGSHETACTRIAAGSTYNETLYSTGTSLKISKTDSIKSGEQTQFEYTIAGGKIWYDISFVNCAEGESASNCPGHAEGLSMRGSNSDCSAASCEAGSYCPTQAYYVDQPLIKLGIKEPVFDCPTPDVDMYMAVCSGGAGNSSNSSQKRSIAGRIAY